MDKIIKEYAYKNLTEEEKIGLIGDYNNLGNMLSGVSIQIDYSENTFKVVKVVDLIEYMKNNDNQFYEKYKLLFQERGFVFSMDCVVMTTKKLNEE